jgi:hypothetical protein
MEVAIAVGGHNISAIPFIIVLIAAGVIVHVRRQRGKEPPNGDA